MSELYSEDFDEMEEGLSPPTDWTADGVYTPGTFEVDDVQSHSPDHSIWLKAGASNHMWVRKNWPGGFTSEKITFWVYFPDTTHARFFLPQDTAANYTASAQTIYFIFGDDAKMEYYDGATTHYTGTDYETGWHKMEFVHDFDNDTFDAWYDDVQIVTGGSFRYDADSCKSLQFMSSVTGQSEWWIDDVQIGEDDEPFPLGPAQSGPIAGGIPT